MPRAANGSISSFVSESNSANSAQVISATPGMLVSTSRYDSDQPRVELIFDWIVRHHSSLFVILRRYVLQRARRSKTGEDHSHGHRFGSAGEIRDDVFFGQPVELFRVDTIDCFFGLYQIP